MAKRREPDHVPPMLQDSYTSVEFEDKIETCMTHVGRALTAHKKIAEKIRKIVDDEFPKENGDTSYDLEEFDDLGPENVAPVLL